MIYEQCNTKYFIRDFICRKCGYFLLRFTITEVLIGFFCDHQKTKGTLCVTTLKIGVAGPVGAGKTALIEKLTRKMASKYSVAVITNDIYTQEDAEFLTKNSLLPPERIMGVETGGCPHTAIREDASMNLEAVDEMVARFPDVEIVFIESGGDNLSATFKPRFSRCDHFL